MKEYIQKSCPITYKEMMSGCKPRSWIKITIAWRVKLIKMESNQDIKNKISRACSTI